MDCESIQMVVPEEPNLADRKECSKRGRRPGRKTSTEKIDVKAKLERSRQSARECRARKKLRYQYLEELVADREKAVLALRSELERFMQWSERLDKNYQSNEIADLLDEINILKHEH